MWALQTSAWVLCTVQPVVAPDVLFRCFCLAALCVFKPMRLHSALHRVWFHFRFYFETLLFRSLSAFFLHHPVFSFHLPIMKRSLSLSLSPPTVFLFSSEWFVCVCVWKQAGRGAAVLTLNIINKSSPFQFKRLINATDTSQHEVDRLSISLLCSWQDRDRAWHYWVMAEFAYNKSLWTKLFLDFNGLHLAPAITQHGH